MTDIIRKAIESSTVEKQRTAEGMVEGNSVVLKKEQYEVGQRGPTAWRIAVYVEGDRFATEKEGDLDAQEAEDKFQSLKKEYTLHE